MPYQIKRDSIMLFSASILSGFFLDTLFGANDLCSFISGRLKTFWCIPVIFGSAVILPYLYGHAPFSFYVFHTILCFFSLQIGQSFCSPTPAQPQTTQQDIKGTLEHLSIRYLDRCAVSILSMLIGGAPLTMLTALLCSVPSICSRIKPVVRYIPARFGAFFLMIVCGLLGYDLNNSRRIYQRDRKKHPEPEVGQVLSVYAGALHLCFPAQGALTIGNVDRPATSADIPTMKHICLSSSWFMLLTGCFIRLTFLL